MPNAGSFKRGEKKPNQGKRGPGKATANAREAIARFVDGNADRLQGWLDAVAQKDGPRAAFDCFKDLLEYHVPKLSRSEVNQTVTATVGTMTDAELEQRIRALTGAGAAGPEKGPGKP